jgi:hypothetical protein
LISRLRLRLSLTNLIVRLVLSEKEEDSGQRSEGVSFEGVVFDVRRRRWFDELGVARSAIVHEMPALIAEESVFLPISGAVWRDSDRWCGGVKEMEPLWDYISINLARKIGAWNQECWSKCGVINSVNRWNS